MTTAIWRKSPLERMRDYFRDVETPASPQDVPSEKQYVPLEEDFRKKPSVAPEPLPALAGFKHIVIGQPGRAIVPFARHLGDSAWQKPDNLQITRLAEASDEIAGMDVTIYALDNHLPHSISSIGRAHWFVARAPIDYPLMLTTSEAFIPAFQRHRVKLVGNTVMYSPESDVAEWSAEEREKHRALGQRIRPLLPRIQTARRLARFNKVEMGRRFGPLGSPRVLVLGRAMQNPDALQSNPEGIEDIDVIRMALSERRDARIIYMPEKEALADTDAIDAVRNLSDRIQIVDQPYSLTELSHVASEVRTVDSPLGLMALAAGLRVVAHGRPPYSGLGLTRDLDANGSEQSSRLANPIDLDTFLGWQFGECILFADVLDGSPIGVEEFLARWTPYLGEMADEIAARIADAARGSKQRPDDRGRFINALFAHAKNEHIQALARHFEECDAAEADIDLALFIAHATASRGDWKGAVARLGKLWKLHGEISRPKMLDALLTIRRGLSSSDDARAFPGYMVTVFRNAPDHALQEVGRIFSKHRYFGAALACYEACEPNKAVLTARAKCEIAVGNCDDAESIISALVKMKASVGDLRLALAERQGKTDYVIAVLERRLEAKVDSDLMLRLANIYREAGRLPAAIDLLLRLLRTKHGQAAGRLLTIIHFQRMEIPIALGFLEAHLQEFPTDASAWKMKADICSFENNLEGCGNTLLKVLMLSPANIGAHTQLLEIEGELGRIGADGLGPWTRAFDGFLSEIDQHSVETLMSQGRTRLQQHDLNTLQRNCLTVNRLFPEDVSAHAWRAHALAWEPGEKSQEVLSAIRAGFDLALARERDDQSLIMQDAIRSMAHAGDIAGVRAIVRRNRFSLYVGDRERFAVPRISAAMVFGDFAGAFEAMKDTARTRILRRNARPFRLTFTLSDIKLEENVLLMSEGGVGDELRFSTLYPEISQRLGRFAITLDERLYTLFKRSFPSIERFIPIPRLFRKRLNRDMLDVIGELPDKDLAPYFNNEAWQAAISSDVVMPVNFAVAELRRSAEDFKAAYDVRLIPRPDLVSAWKERLAPLADRLIVGVTWTSTLRQYQRIGNYLAHHEMAPLFLTPGTVFINCQYEPMEEELRWAREHLGVEIVDFPDLDKKDDFEGLAALIANLDLFIGTGTTTTEFAAQVGCPTIYASPANMNAYRNPDHTERDLYFDNVAHIRPIPGSDRASMMGRIEALLNEAVARKLSSRSVGVSSSQAPRPRKRR